MPRRGAMGTPVDTGRALCCRVAAGEALGSPRIMGLHSSVCAGAAS
ncbi:hypothetical protein [uncultured Halomonas sp.]|nr:hypothetical protein [uncultured Halomonas sp.]